MVNESTGYARNTYSYYAMFKIWFHQSGVIQPFSGELAEDYDFVYIY